MWNTRTFPPSSATFLQPSERGLTSKGGSGGSMKWTTKLSLAVAVAAAVLVVPTLTFAGSNDQFDRYPYRYRYEARREAREAMRDARQAIREAHREMLR